MKKLISILLVLILCVGAFPLPVFSQEIDYQYTNNEKESIYLKYIDNEHMLDTLFCNDEAVGYWNMINNIEKNKALKWSLDAASKIIGEYPEEQVYAEILANLITMQSGDIAEQVQMQSKFDNLKSGMDYAMDYVDIAEAFVGGAGILESISPIIDAVTGGAGVIIDNVEQGKYYETIIQDYAQSKMFLEAVSKYAQNEELRNVATTLLAANDKLLEKRLEYLIDSTESLVNYEAEFFIENMSFALLKTADIYKSNEVVKWYVDCGEKLSNSIELIFSAGVFAFKMTMLAGDIGFGTSNTFNRYQEMKVVSDIAGAIVEANSQIVVQKGAETLLPDIQTKCNYYKMLITTHARGEYLIYKLLINDAKLLSDIRVLFDYFKDPEDTTDSWYSGQINCLTKYYNILNKMFEVSDVDDIPSDAVEFNGHYYYLYDSGTASSYEEALQYCQDKGGYLATLTSQEENDFVYAYLGYKNCANAYFGLSDAANEGTWEWCTGEEVFYTNWNSGEPNDENPEEDYGEFYFKYPDGKWNDGDFGNSTAGDTNAFLCEWGDYTVQQTGGSGGQKTTSDERDVVLVLDASGSMAGTPLEETKKASSKFINTVLEQDASIGIVTYDEIANRVSEFSMNQTALQNAVSEVGDGGGTNIEAGLYEARSMLQTSNAKKKIIVLMSDGEPNNGKVGENLIAYADEIKKEEILIYTIGFFESLTEKSDAQRLMEQLASDGCHYEVAKADDLVFFFEDMADQINGQKYIYVRIACPVDVSVTYNGQTLSSSDRDSNFRTDFGTLTFEEKEVDSSEEAEEDYEETGEIDDRIKVLRLKEGVDYDLKLTGTGRGVMNYTIGFMDEDGNYSDLRKFKDIRVSRRTTIDTVAAVSPESILNIDEDGDGKYDIKMRAEENGYGEEMKTPAWVIYAMCVAGILIVIDIFIIVILRATKKRKVRR